MNPSLASLLLPPLLLLATMAGRAEPGARRMGSEDEDDVCPERCGCFEEGMGPRAAEERGSYVDCAGRNVTEVPIPIEDLKYSTLLLQENRITQVDLDFLRHFPDLKVRENMVYLTSSKVYNNNSNNSKGRSNYLEILNNLQLIKNIPYFFFSRPCLCPTTGSAP